MNLEYRERLVSLIKEMVEIIQVDYSSNEYVLLSDISTVAKQISYEKAAGSGITRDEENLILAGQLIPAIKSVRQRTGIGLKEAKDMVDDFRESLRNAGKII